MAFSTTPTTSSQGALATNQVPLGEVYVPNHAGGNATALQGGPASTDSNSNESAPVATYTPDGNDVTQGLSTDLNTANTVMGRLTKIRDLLNATLPTQDIEQANYTALTTPPAATNAGSDTPLTFSSQVSRVIIQNNTSANVYYAFDTTATLGSLVLTPGSFLVYPKKCTVLHLYTAAAQNINGTAVGGIVVLGAL